VVALFPAPAKPWTLQLSLHRDLDHGPLAEVTLQPTASDVPKAEIVIPAAALSPGLYAVRAVLLDYKTAEIEHAQRDFLRRPATPVPRSSDCCPIEIPLLVEPYPDPLDASWGISTVVPFPRGLVHETDKLMLLEDGQPIPAQFTIKARWSRLGSASWVGLDFVAHYKGGRPAGYVIRISRTTQVSTPAPNVATDRPDAILLQTAGGRLVIHKRKFVGPVRDVGGPGRGRTPAAPNGGPYVVDEAGKVYRAGNAPPDSIAIVENGPVQATVVVKGWYTAGGQPTTQTRLCRYVTQITAFANSPVLRISHRTILTFDPDYTKLADVGWRIPPSNSGPARFGIDDEVRQIAPNSANGAFVHQDRHDRCWVVTTQGVHEQRHGPMRRANGCLSVADHAGRRTESVTVLFRDMFQKFPKELGVTWTSGSAELSVHFWPRHGQRAFTLVSAPPTPSTTKSTGTIFINSGMHIRVHSSTSRCPRTT
jgi:hypothetical protein